RRRAPPTTARSTTAWPRPSPPSRATTTRRWCCSPSDSTAQRRHRAAGDAAERAQKARRLGVTEPLGDGFHRQRLVAQQALRQRRHHFVADVAEAGAARVELAPERAARAADARGDLVDGRQVLARGDREEDGVARAL